MEPPVLVKPFFLYLLTNADGSRIYTGITNDLKRRVRQHRAGRGGRYTAAFQLSRLVYFENCDTKSQALQRELQVKRSRRRKKIAMIEAMNAGWRDLFDDL